MKAIASSTRVQRKPGIMHSRVDDAVYALDAASGACYAFQGPSARLWELLAQPLTAIGAARRLLDEYDIEEQSCAGQVTDHFRSLHEEGLISIVEA